MPFAQPLSFDSLHEASRVILAAYVGAADIRVILDHGKPRSTFTHFLATPGLIMSYAGYAGDRLLSKLPESDCIGRSISDARIRQMILRTMANPALEASVCAEAERQAFQLVQRFQQEIHEAASVLQHHMWQRRSIPADVIERLESVVRVRALGVAEGETDARPEVE